MSGLAIPLGIVGVLFIIAILYVLNLCAKALKIYIDKNKE